MFIITPCLIGTWLISRLVYESPPDMCWFVDFVHDHIHIFVCRSTISSFWFILHWYWMWLCIYSRGRKQAKRVNISTANKNVRTQKYGIFRWCAFLVNGLENYVFDRGFTVNYGFLPKRAFASPFLVMVQCILQQKCVNCNEGPYEMEVMRGKVLVESILRKIHSFQEETLHWDLVLQA